MVDLPYSTYTLSCNLQCLSNVILIGLGYFTEHPSPRTLSAGCSLCTLIANLSLPGYPPHRVWISPLNNEPILEHLSRGSLPGHCSTRPIYPNWMGVLSSSCFCICTDIFQLISFLHQCAHCELQGSFSKLLTWQVKSWLLVWVCLHRYLNSPGAVHTSACFIVLSLYLKGVKQTIALTYP